ncbi:glutathione peroxidase [Salinibius halmophilus]|uniref:glutathione peroxidase n=1 Tax=Salinibius halmophilus TaxID=1853216 RepID=UPI000E663D75|nr:glutathione peroxidase [Salinibius halmophilus]
MTKLIILIASLFTINLAFAQESGGCPAYLDHEFRKLHSAQTINLCDLHSDKPMLIVNTASFCGFTDQFGPLQALHETYGPLGLQIVGFASDSFNQEANSEAEAADVCYRNFGVDFTMLAPTDVTGPNSNPVFSHLAQVSKAPEWNFVKYLVNPDGSVALRLPSRLSPNNPLMVGELEAAFETQQ